MVLDEEDRTTLEWEILELAAAAGRLPLADAFETFDAPVPDVFLTCRGLYATGDLDRVGPGTYELSEFGRRRLDQRSRRTHHQSSSGDDPMAQPSGPSTDDAQPQGESSTSGDAAGGNSFDWSDHDDPQPSGEPNAPMEEQPPADQSDDAESTSAVGEDGFIWSSATSPGTDSTVE